MVHFLNNKQPEVKIYYLTTVDASTTIIGSSEGDSAMKTLGFVISGKENEQRRALLPSDIRKIKNASKLYFESGYGDVLGISDDDYEQAGAKICTKEEVYSCPIVCNVKAPIEKERLYFQQGQTFFGWIHAVQGRAIVDFLLSKKMSCIAWEEMVENDRYIFWRNREISGEAAILHALPFIKKLPYECNVAIVGRGNCFRGAYKILSRLGATIKVYDRVTSPYLRYEIGEYDIVINAVLWDVFRTDHIIYREDLKKMAPGSMIIDISCDEAMGVETSHPTTIADPVYTIDGVIHYAVDHTPALYPKAATESVSKALYPYIDYLVEEIPHPTIERAYCIKDGIILDERIIRFQHR